MAPPAIQTYHCICTSLLLASTHTISSLPTRPSPTNELILPLPSSPPTQEAGDDMPPEGYTLFLGLEKDKRVTVIRREDGFEKRFLLRCSRCRVVVGYELLGQGNKDAQADGSMMDMDGQDAGKGKGKGRERYDGKLFYILPGGVLNTQAMVGGRRVGEDDVNIVGGKGIAVFE